MRVLVDENLPPSVVTALRSLGHEVEWILEVDRGATDAAVIERAASSGRVLVTADKDFGDLVFRQRWPAECGVVLVRARVRGSEALAAVVLDALAMDDGWEGRFTVIEDDRVRVSLLPGTR